MNNFPHFLSKQTFALKTAILIQFPLTSVLLISIAVISIGCSSLSGPAGTARRALNALKNRDAATLVSLMSSSNEEMRLFKVENHITGNAERLFTEAAANFIQEIGGINSFEITNESTNGDIATLNYTVRWNNGDSDTDTMTLVKENGVWKISQFVSTHTDWHEERYNGKHIRIR